MMRSRVSGRSRMRAPSACDTALPIAAAVGPAVDFADAERHLVLGVDQFDVDLRHLAEFQHRIGLPVERGMTPLSKRTCSLSTQLADWMMPPSSWLIAPSGLMTRPASVAHHTCARRISSATSSSTTTAAVGGAVLVARKGDAAAMAGAARLFGIPARHGGDLLDHRARAFVGGDRQPVVDRVLAGALGQFVDAAFEREHVRHGAEAAQRRGAHRRFRHQMMDDALGRDVVERLAVAGGAAAIGFRHVVRRRLGRRIGQRDRAQQICRRRPGGCCGSGSRFPASSRPACRRRRAARAPSRSSPGSSARRRILPRAASARGSACPASAWR